MKVTEYIVEVEDPAGRDVFVVPNLEDLRAWLENLFEDPRITDAALADVENYGEHEYDLDSVDSTYGLDYDDVVGELPDGKIRITARIREVTDADGVLRALHKINVRRARTGQPALDPVESNWSVEDVFKEADRLG